MYKCIKCGEAAEQNNFKCQDRFVTVAWSDPLCNACRYATLLDFAFKHRMQIELAKQKDES